MSKLFAGKTTVSTAMGMTEYMGNEGEIIVWNSVLLNLQKAFNLFSRSDLSRLLKVLFPSYALLITRQNIL